MWTILVNVGRIAIQVLAGVGVSELLDKFVKDKVPAYYPEAVSPGFRVPKLLWLILAFAIAILGLRFIGKKTKIKILR